MANVDPPDDRHVSTLRMMIEAQDPATDEEIRGILENSPARFPADVRFQPGFDSLADAYLKAKFRFLATWERGENTEPASILATLPAVAGLVGAEGLAEYVHSVWTALAPAESQALHSRCRQLGRRSAIDAWYYRCAELDEWIAASEEARRERLRSVWHRDHQGSFASLLQAARERDENAAALVELVNEVLADLALELPVYLHGSSDTLAFTVTISDDMSKVSVTKASGL